MFTNGSKTGPSKLVHPLNQSIMGPHVIVKQSPKVTHSSSKWRRSQKATWEGGPNGPKQYPIILFYIICNGVKYPSKVIIIIYHMGNLHTSVASVNGTFQPMDHQWPLTPLLMDIIKAKHINVFLQMT